MFPSMCARCCTHITIFGLVIAPVAVIITDSSEPLSLHVTTTANRLVYSNYGFSHTGRLILKIIPWFSTIWRTGRALKSAFRTRYTNRYTGYILNTTKCVAFLARKDLNSRIKWLVY
jgi:hypothetical protein